MKKLIKSYVTFTRTERMGLIVLCALLLILISVRATMYLWVHPTVNPEDEKKLVAAWETFKHTQTIPKPIDTTAEKDDYMDAGDENETPLPAIVNLNTADSATLVRFKGIGPVTAGNIVARRRNKGPFTDIEQLRETGSFSKSTFETLKRHLVVK